MLNFIPDIASNTKLSNSLNNIKKEADIQRTELSTGKYVDITKAVRGDVGSVHLLQKSLDDVKNYQTNLTLAQNRATRSQSVLEVISEDTMRIATGALSASGLEDRTALQAIGKDAESVLAGMFGALNSSFDGRALFGGDVTNQPPLINLDQMLLDVSAITSAGPDEVTINAALDTYFNDPAGGFYTNIYQGGDGDAPMTEIAPSVRIKSTLKADDPAIKDLLRGLSVLATANSVHDPDGDGELRETIIEQNAALTANSERSVVQLRASLGTAQSRIEQAYDRYVTEEHALTEMLNSKISADPYEAATRLQLLETQLQTGYTMTARMAQLSLANYL